MPIPAGTRRTATRRGKQARPATAQPTRPAADAAKKRPATAGAARSPIRVDLARPPESHPIRIEPPARQPGTRDHLADKKNCQVPRQAGQAPPRFGPKVHAAIVRAGLKNPFDLDKKNVLRTSSCRSSESSCDHTSTIKAILDIESPLTQVSDRHDEHFRANHPRRAGGGQPLQRAAGSSNAVVRERRVGRARSRARHVEGLVPGRLDEEREGFPGARSEFAGLDGVGRRHERPGREDLGRLADLEQHGPARRRDAVLGAGSRQGGEAGARRGGNLAARRVVEEGRRERRDDRVVVVPAAPGAGRARVGSAWSSRPTCRRDRSTTADSVVS